MRWTQLPDTPNAPGVGGAFAGAHGEILIAAGGSNFPDKPFWEGGAKAWHDTVWTLKPKARKWKEAGKLARPLAYGVSVGIRQGLLCIGGADALRHYADCFILSVAEDGSVRTDSFPELPRPLAYAAGALVGSKVIVAGGTERPDATAASSAAYAIDLANLNAGWKELPLWGGSGRLLAQAAGTKDTFFLFGGVALKPGAKGTEREHLADCHAFRLGKEWRRIADLPRPVAAAATPCPVVGPIVALIGGDDGSASGKQEPANHPGFGKGILTYDTQFDAWAESGEAPVGRVTLPCARWNGGFVLVNGETSPARRSAEVWQAFA